MAAARRAELRGDERAAHTNFKIAISQIKSMGEGKTLAHQYWRFVKDLVPADRAARFAAYFDTRETPQAAQTDETSQEETPQEETTVQPNAPESGSEA